MTSLDVIVESLIQEKDKLVQMGVIQTSKKIESSNIDKRLKQCASNREVQREGSQNHWFEAKGESYIFWWSLGFQEKEEIRED